MQDRLLKIMQNRPPPLSILRQTSVVVLNPRSVEGKVAFAGMILQSVPLNWWPVEGYCLIRDVGKTLEITP